MKKFAIPFCLGVLLVFKTGCAAAETTPQQQQWLSKAYRYDKAGWIYLHIEGEPRERGFQHGYLLAKDIAESLRITRAMWHFHTSMDWDWLVAQSRKVVNPAIDEENRTEIEGMVEGMKAAGVATTLDEMIAYNDYIELRSDWWPDAKKELDKGKGAPEEKKDACSSFIATGSMTADGGIVLGHNTMSDYVYPFSNVVLDVLPAKGHRILMQTQPGWVSSGTDFFITDAGLVGSETTIGGYHDYSMKGIPEFARMRRATQDAGNIDEWCAIMKQGNNGGYANAWLLGDVNSGEIARLELGLKYVGFEKKKDGYFTGSNIAEDLHLLRFETSERDTDIRLSSVARRVRWNQLMKANAGKIDVKTAETMEGDDYDVYLHKNNPGSRTISGHDELDGNPIAGTAYSTGGSIDAKVVDSKMAKRMAFAARWGTADGIPFDAAAFLAAQPQFGWEEGLLKDRPTEPWVEFQAGQRP